MHSRRLDLNGLFREQAEKFCNYRAILDGQETITYGELDKTTNQVAQWLKESNVTKGDRIILLFEPSIEFIIFAIGILKAKAVYVPLDIKSPKLRTEYIIQDVKPKLIFTNQSIDLNVPIKTYNTYTDVHYKNCKENSHCVDVGGDFPACVFYTSGTTGKPKGVIISHSSIINLTYTSNFTNIQEGEIIAQFSNLAFDAVTFEIWAALLNGATILVIPLIVKQDHNKLKQLFSQVKPNYIFLPTTYFHQGISLFPDTFDSLSTILFGGEQINVDLIKSFIKYRKEKVLPVNLFHVYGPTEATTFSCFHKICCENDNDSLIASIGKPINNVKAYILNEQMEQLEQGEVGELYISGANLALSYNNLPELNREKFIKNPFNKYSRKYGLLYKTGDFCKYLPDKNILYVGRSDDQIKISGYRVQMFEVESCLLTHPDIVEVAVLCENKNGYNSLSAYIVLKEPNTIDNLDNLRSYLAEYLPLYMIPSKFIVVKKLPLNNNGKIDKEKLLLISEANSTLPPRLKIPDTINKITAIFNHLLNRNHTDIDKNLFELGANSLIITEACFKINKELGSSLKIADILTFPTIYKLSSFLESNTNILTLESKDNTILDIAVVGMSCRFPQSNSLEQYWINLCEGKDCLTTFETKEIDFKEDRYFVPVRGIVEDIDKFDASFFNFDPSDASITDPQQRIFLECAWEALEMSGNTPDKNKRKIISTFGGMADSAYLQNNLLKSSWFWQQFDLFNARIASSIGTMSTQVSYRLNLTGKSININTACSTSLVAIDEACRDLANRNSDIALAGGVSFDFTKGYYYQRGGIESKDGKCRPFDKNASGTVFSDGVGVVVLKRLEDAIKDNDTIYAVIKGCGINNDGGNKLGYTAPSTIGQANCIKMAINQAKVDVEDIGLLESHGTATELGDVVEVEALSTVYQKYTSKKQYCVLGATKGNIGHTDIAAGIAGFIKAVLCLYHKKIPPTLYYEQDNPNINLAESPFFISKELINWDSGLRGRYAGVSAFGIGGTNAHVILSEYQQLPVEPKSKFDNKLMIISAKSKKALEENKDKIISAINDDITCSEIYLSDLAYTLQIGRDDFTYRKFAIGVTKEEITNHLKQSKIYSYKTGEPKSIVFMFSGQGAQYQCMASQLLDSVEYFRSIVFECATIVKKYFDFDIIEVIQSETGLINETKYTQPALFIIEYALAKLFMYYGVIPGAMIGHSIGEYVAACIAEIFTLEDAIRLVCTRGALMSNAPTGVMISIECSLEEFFIYKGALHIDLAVYNSTNNCVAAGTTEAIADFESILKENQATYQKLKVSHAFHSYLMQDASENFEQFLKSLKLNTPKFPLISNVTGTWLTKQEATSPEYWSKHIKKTVLFKNGIDTLIDSGYRHFLEIGPGSSLYSFVNEMLLNRQDVKVITHVLPNHKRLVKDEYQLLTALGKLWCSGIEINWNAFYSDEKRRKIPIPTYAFQKQRYWVEPDLEETFDVIKQAKIDERFYQPSWLRKHSYKVLANSLNNLRDYCWIIFGSLDDSLSKELYHQLNKYQTEVFLVEASSSYKKVGNSVYTIATTDSSDYVTLFEDLKDRINYKQICILHLLSKSEVSSRKKLISEVEINKRLAAGFYSLLYMTQAYIETIGEEHGFNCAIVTNGSQQVLGTDIINPVNASLTGICRVIPQEHHSLKFKMIDLGVEKDQDLAAAILGTCTKEEWVLENPIIAFRNNYLFQPIYSQVKLEPVTDRLKDNGIYLITGGVGGISLTLSEIIAKKVSQPIFILLTRSSFPNVSEWDTLLKAKDVSKQKLQNKISKVQYLQSLGAEVYIEQCDITEIKSIQNTVQKYVDLYGKIDGVIHSAGIAGGGLSQLKTKEIAERVFAPKLLGTYNLAKSLENYTPDFVVLCSSVSALIGEQGQVDYCAANACLDAFATSNIFGNCFTVSINWNTWQSVGMAVETEKPSDVMFLDRGNDITPQEGQYLFLKILQNDYSQIAISNFDINVFSKMVCSKGREQPILNIAREELSIDNTYIPPSNYIEIQLAQIWQEILGIEQIGVADDFFELGGHSLKALKLIEAISKKLKYRVSVNDIFTSKTIANLANVITDNKASSLQVDQLANIVLPLKEQRNNVANIFMFHPVGGTTFCFQPLVDLWNLPFTIYGVQDPSIYSGKLEFSSLLEMAKLYYYEIKKAQPEGPYYLLGYSFGGTIAYEIACLLKQGNDVVSFVGMLDSWAVFSPAQKDEKIFKAYMQTQNMSEDMVNLSWKRMELLTSHRPSKSELDVLLLKSTTLMEEYQDIDDPCNGWKNYILGKLDILPINANHNNILLEGNAELVYNILKARLSTIIDDEGSFILNDNSHPATSENYKIYN